MFTARNIPWDRIQSQRLQVILGHVGHDFLLALHTIDVLQMCLRNEATECAARINRRLLSAAHLHDKRDLIRYNRAVKLVQVETIVSLAVENAEFVAGARDLADLTVPRHSWVLHFRMIRPIFSCLESEFRLRTLLEEAEVWHEVLHHMDPIGLKSEKDFVVQGVRGVTHCHFRLSRRLLGSSNPQSGHLNLSSPSRTFGARGNSR